MQIEDQNQSGNVAVIVAAGSGHRAGRAQGRSKQYCLLSGEPVLKRTLRAFLDHPSIGNVIAVIKEGDQSLYQEAANGLQSAKLLPPATGGETRQQSVAAGLLALGALSPAGVIIHDAARPFVSAACIGDTLAALTAFEGAIAAAPVTDTLKRAESGVIKGTVSRDGLWRAQTPQAFRYRAIAKAHDAATGQGLHHFTDDAALAEWAGFRVAIVENHSENMKITTAEDLSMAELIASSGALADVRCGTGFDVHAFRDGDHITLCGVTIPHTRGVEAHSDGDVGLHALTDALLGTIGAGDIGDHFPPSDERWRGANSSVFLSRAVRLVHQRGGRITNADITIVCESPKIGPHRETMRLKIAGLLAVALERVSIKATTSERLGFTGRREGLTALATATVVF